MSDRYNNFPVNTKVTPAPDFPSGWTGEVGTVVQHRNRHGSYSSQGVSFPNWPNVVWFSKKHLVRV